MSKITAKEIIEDKLAEKIKDRPELIKSIGVLVAIDLKGEGGGRWLIDLSKTPATMKLDSYTKAVTTISAEVAVFEQIASGEMDPQTAFLTGQLKIDGNLGVAIKLGQLFGGK